MTGRSSWRRVISSFPRRRPESAVTARTMSHPAIRSVGANNWKSGSPSSAQPARASWRACWPSPATARTRRNACCRWWPPIHARTSWRRWSGPCSYGAFSLAAVQRILAARSQPKTPLDALADDHRTYLDGLLERDPTPPRPTSDYQALLREEPTMPKRSSPHGKTIPERPEPADPDGEQIAQPS